MRPKQNLMCPYKLGGQGGALDTELGVCMGKDPMNTKAGNQRKIYKPRLYQQITRS